MSTMQIWSHCSTPTSNSWFKPSGMWLCTHGRYIYLLKPTLGPPKKVQHLTRPEEVVITRLRIGHTKATKSHILSRESATTCHHCGHTLTIDHMLLECAVLRESRNEYYTAVSLNTLFETIPESCIVEFLREAGFFYLIWTVRHSIQTLTWTIPKLKQFLTSCILHLIWMPIYPVQLFISNELATAQILNLTTPPDLFVEDKQTWENPTCEGRLIYPEGCAQILKRSLCQWTAFTEVKISEEDFDMQMYSLTTLRSCFSNLLDFVFVQMYRITCAVGVGFCFNILLWLISYPL